MRRASGFVSFGRLCGSIGGSWYGSCGGGGRLAALEQGKSIAKRFKNPGHSFPDTATGIAAYVKEIGRAHV